MNLYSLYTNLRKTASEFRNFWQINVPNHLRELQASGISPEIIEANFESCGGEAIIEWLTEAKIEQMGGHAQQYATTKVAALLNRMEPVAKSGWRFQGVDPLNRWQRMEWGCFKPDSPRDGFKRGEDGAWKPTGKAVKYEHPQGQKTRAFFPAVPSSPEYWSQVLERREVPILIAEGAKKAASLISHGYPAIGLPGVTQWNIPGTRDLIPELELFAEKDREFLICFDQDDKPSTVRRVRAEIFKLSAALRRQQCKVRIIEWDRSLGKGADDLLVSKDGPNVFAEAVRNAIPYEVFSVRAQSALSFEPDWICPSGVRYLTDGGLLEAIPDDAKLIGLRSPKGSGKTEAARAIAHAAIEKGQPVLLISHRIQLTNALAQRVQVLSIYEASKADRQIARAEALANGMALCIHSCHPGSQAQFEAKDWEDALIIIDEATQVWWELLNSSLIKKQRVAILREMRDLLTRALSPESEGRILLMDADLDDITINSIRGAANQADLKPWIGTSNYQGFSYNATIQACPEQWLINAEKELEKGRKILIMTDSQKQKGRFSSIALEQRLNQRFPGLRILRVDSKTLSLANHPAFGCIDKANEIFKDYDVVVCSPSIETGISLDLKGHFDAVYGCFQGVLSENSVRQSLARLRDPVDRIIYLAPCGLDLIAGGETYWEALQDNQSQQIKAQMSTIFDAARDDLRTDFLPSQVEAFSRYAARHNAGLACYREVVVARLRDEGQQVSVAEPESQAEEIAAVRDETKIERHDRLLAHGEAVIAADAITDSEYEKACKSRSLENEQKALELERKALSNRYAIAPTLDLYILDQYGWHSKILLHYYLTDGRDFLKARDQKQIEDLLEKAGESKDLWAPDIVRSSLSLKIAYLEWLGIGEILQMADRAGSSDIHKDWIHANHPLVLAIAEKAQANARPTKLALGIAVGKSAKPMNIIRELLGKLGFGLGQAKRIGPRGQQTRFYPVERIDHHAFCFGKKESESAIIYQCDRDQIFQAWAERDLNHSNTAETAVEQEFQPIATTQSVATAGNNRSYSPRLVATPPRLISEGGEAENAPPKPGGHVSFRPSNDIERCAELLCRMRTYAGWQLTQINFPGIVGNPELLALAWARVPETQQNQIREILTQGLKRFAG